MTTHRDTGRIKAQPPPLRARPHGHGQPEHKPGNHEGRADTAGNENDPVPRPDDIYTQAQSADGEHHSGQQKDTVRRPELQLVGTDRFHGRNVSAPEETFQQTRF
jgi:hypothetical protein